MFCYPTDGPKTGGGGELISGILQYIGLAFKTSTRDNEHISPILLAFRYIVLSFKTNTRGFVYDEHPW